jgi:hypothetical protein
LLLWFLCHDFTGIAGSETVIQATTTATTATTTTTATATTCESELLKV